MTGWLIFVGYLLMVMITWRVAFSLMLDRDAFGDDDRTMVVAITSLPAVFWPMALVLAPMVWFVMRPTSGERREDRERKLQEREREVERLERKYGL